MKQFFALSLILSILCVHVGIAAVSKYVFDENNIRYQLVNENNLWPQNPVGFCVRSLGHYKTQLGQCCEESLRGCQQL